MQLFCCNFYSTIYRSSHRRYSVTKGVLRNFAKFTGKHLCQSLFFNKVAGLRPATLLKRRLWHRCFPVNFAKFLRRPVLQNTFGRLLLLLLLVRKVMKVSWVILVSENLFLSFFLSYVLLTKKTWHKCMDQQNDIWF